MNRFIKLLVLLSVGLITVEETALSHTLPYTSPNERMGQASQFIRATILGAAFISFIPYPEVQKPRCS